METSKTQEKQNTKQMGVAENPFSKCKYQSVTTVSGLIQICGDDKYCNGFVPAAE